MKRPRPLFRLLMLAGFGVSIASFATAASTRGVRPKASARAVAPSRAHSTVVPPHTRAMPRASRSAYLGTNRHPMGQRRGGYGVSHYSSHRSGAATGPLISSLHGVVARLHQADHDYEGHRVQAIHQLNQAIGALTPGPGGVPHPGTNAGHSTGPKLTQAQSDAHLRQAHQELVALESRLGGGGTTAGSHPQAQNHIRQALGHLNTALATR